MKNENKQLSQLSKNELIESALLSAVSGAGCEVWTESCGCAKEPGEGNCCDYCGSWGPGTVILPEPALDEL